MHDAQMTAIKIPSACNVQYKMVLLVWNTVSVQVALGGDVMLSLATQGRTCWLCLFIIYCHVTVSFQQHYLQDVDNSVYR